MRHFGRAYNGQLEKSGRGALKRLHDGIGQDSVPGRLGIHPRRNCENSRDPLPVGPERSRYTRYGSSREVTSIYGAPSGAPFGKTIMKNTDINDRYTLAVSRNTVGHFVPASDDFVYGNASIDNELDRCFVERPTFDYEFETYEAYLNRTGS